MLMSATVMERDAHFMETYPDITQKGPQKMIASYLGISPEALSRIRKELSIHFKGFPFLGQHQCFYRLSLSSLTFKKSYEYYHLGFPRNISSTHALYRGFKISHYKRTI